jgi:hypothetical protein
MHSKQLKFQVRKCNDTYRDKWAPPCHNSSVIDEYIEDIQVEAWAMGHGIEFGHMDHGEPVLTSMEPQSSYLLSPEKRKTDLILL